MRFYFDSHIKWKLLNTELKEEHILCRELTIFINAMHPCIHFIAFVHKNKAYKNEIKNSVSEKEVVLQS